MRAGAGMSEEMLFVDDKVPRHSIKMEKARVLHSLWSHFEICCLHAFLNESTCLKY